jgi:hypothetical protein
MIYGLFIIIGYKGIYKRRTGDKTDGCAIFYKATRFSFVDKLPLEYHQPHIPVRFLKILLFIIIYNNS